MSKKKISSLTVKPRNGADTLSQAERYNSEFSIEDATLSIQREQNRGRIGKQSTSTNEILKIKHLHRKTKHVLMESSR